MKSLNSETLKNQIDYTQLKKKVDDALEKKKGKYLFYFLTVFRNPKSIINYKLLEEKWKNIKEVDLNFKSETIKECKYIQGC